MELLKADAVAGFFPRQSARIVALPAARSPRRLPINRVLNRRRP
jgi:hypothetical protein